jgi:GxxExxY protein
MFDRQDRRMENRAEVELLVNQEALNDLSKRVISCALIVAGTLGTGFAERIYEAALAHELRKTGLLVAQQRRISVWYDNVNIGDFTVDLLVEDDLLVELKAVRALEDTHRGQCLNYLKATGLRLCLLLNFGTPRLEIKRVVRGL